MKVFVQGEDKLIPLQSEVTEDSIEQALGYTPANEDDLPDISNDDDSTLYVVDKDGNIITKTDSDGFHASAMTVNGKDVESGLVTEEDRASWGGSDLDDVISKDDDTTLHIVDSSGNVIAKIDKDGLHTTEVELGGEGETKVNVKEHIENGDIHPTVHEWAKAETKPTYTAKEVGLGNVDNTADRDKPISTAQQAALDAMSEQIVSPNGEWTVTDKNGNIIATIDANGLHTTEVYVNGKSVSGLIEEGSTALSAEITRATAAEKANETAISNEETRARSAESALSSSIATVESIAKGASQAVAFGNYSTMVTALNALPNDTYKVGQSILIGTVDVPDLWVSEIATENKAYTYTNDSTLTAYLAVYHKVQVGYYVLSQLETQKVDLTEYAKNSDLETHAATDTHITSSERTAWNTHKDSKENPHGVTKAQVGLGNVDNTSDADKPVSTAQQAALDALAEQIVSPKDEWTVTDKDGNIIATIDADGLHTTTVVADKVYSEGSKCITQESLRSLNYVNATHVVEFVDSKFANVATPTNGSDAANKKYVDDTVEGALKGSSAEILAFTLSGNSYTCTGFISGVDADDIFLDIVIPAEYNGKPVTAIGNSAFYGQYIKSCTLPSTITSIGANAFMQNPTMRYINIPVGVTTIGSGAFTYCSKLIIYCEATEAGSGWNSSWNGSNRPIYWGCDVAHGDLNGSEISPAVSVAAYASVAYGLLKGSYYYKNGSLGNTLSEVSLNTGKAYLIYLSKKSSGESGSTVSLYVPFEDVIVYSTGTYLGDYCLYDHGQKKLYFYDKNNTLIDTITYISIREL